MKKTLTGTEKKDVLSGVTEEQKRSFRELFYGVTEEELREIIEDTQKEWEKHLRSLVENHTEIAEAYIALYGKYLFRGKMIDILERRLRAQREEEKIDEALVAHTLAKSFYEGLLEGLSEGLFPKPEDLRS